MSKPTQSSGATTSLSWPTIAINTLCFALGFAAWVAFGPSVRLIARELHIAPSLAALVKALPILVGSVCRIPVGIATDRLGARRMFPAVMVVAAVAALATSWATTLTHLVAGGLALGLIGTTFTVGAASVSARTPAARQGFALGLFGAGNVGTALTTFGLPMLMRALGWRGSFRVYAAVLVAGAALYALTMRDARRTAAPPALRTLLAPLKDLRAWRFGLNYAATFGVFVATTLTVADIYVDGYRVSLETAGLLATTFTFSASLVRIAGGGLADRFGARPVLRLAFAVIVLLLAPVALHPPLGVTVVLVLGAGLAMGVGMAASFKQIPEYYPRSVGAVGGIVGALGGVGGFVLPIVATSVKAATGSPFSTVLPLATTALAAGVVQWIVDARQAQGASASVPERATEAPVPARQAIPSIRP